MEQRGDASRGDGREGPRAAPGWPGAEPGTSAERLEEVLRSELPTYLVEYRTGGFVWDLTADEVYLDPGALAVFGLRADEFDGRPDTLRALMVVHDSPRLAQGAATGASEYGAYFRIRSPEGPLRWAHVHARYVRAEDGTALRAVGVLRNADEELRHAAQQSALGRERERRLDVTRTLNAELSRVMTVQDLLELATGQPFLDLVGASGVALSVLDRDRRVVLATTGLPAALVRDLGTGRLDGPMPLAEAIRSDTPLFITREDVRDTYPPLWPHIEPTDLTAAAVIPLAAQGAATGALAVLFKDRRDFTPDERNLLLSLGATFSQSLQRALLYDREHAMSVALQQSMLPGHIPDVPGASVAVRYQPDRTGHQVGGDWYDVIVLPGGKVMLVVGDVEGHDVQAAAVMGQLRAALRAYSTEGHPPTTVMARASRFLYELDTDLIATCVCVHLDPANGAGMLVRAGHPYPIVRRSDGRSFTIDVPGDCRSGSPLRRRVLPHPLRPARPRRDAPAVHRRAAGVPRLRPRHG